MSQYDELKRLAEAQPVKEWSRDGGRQPSMPGRELMFYVEGPEGVSDYEDWGFTRSAASYIAAADPAAILALIAENERNQRMVLSACMSMGAIGESLGLDMDSDGDEMLGMVAELKAERDQLRAEIAGLRTGYEAYERVNAELKAENEALVSALNEILQVTPMGVEAFGIAALVLGELSAAAMGKGEQ
ncbi:hypothetical protein [Pseudomonas antarctica]|uniref:hypothetical protein n=1 Tax=Pseudomonas antarctica TaxID=219572 RepID=UPI003F74DCB6